MPSLLPDFEYDIFISYRHNDNRSGWISEFVNALQEELAVCCDPDGERIELMQIISG